jgi:hypothetical protein
MTDKPELQKPQGISINAADEISRGRYSNLLLASSSPDEFVLDWLLNSPNGAHLVARIILSPGNLKRTIETLKISLQQYEGKFGPIKVIDADGQKVH